MNKFVVHIVVSALCILVPIVVLVYGYWDIHQPKVGPVGDGKPNYPTLPQLLPIIICFLLGVGNLPIAIMRYRQNKRASHEDRKNED
ncbi:hypothetical protein PAECIP111893_01628 [Paenibacillus plantiphilus]|uniref:Uncharacterized protein n=1 Tax=Paenibacillus plantiphilus TaxID=2905650 RepID=A0ABM9C3I3_9BACL|nr:hypothetical protein [Paenibacillus plantiphilus]CAH1201482.1 hypothetical protein PAECIP111893_01628 [Paenibacillus plantiphilus]